MAMVGGGVGAFIGKVHRAAARFNGDVDFVAGAFSSDPDRSRAQAPVRRRSPPACAPIS